MSRPSFAAWSAAQEIYDPIDPGARAAKVIGGKVAMNIAPAGRWTNFCAVRMSFILNRSGTLIPYVPNKTVSGADKRWYFHYVRDVIAFLNVRWGAPDLIARYPPSGGGPLAKQKGLVLFEIAGWDDATGHATLWNGQACYDHCYFNDASANYQTTPANFWKLS